MCKAASEPDLVAHGGTYFLDDNELDLQGALGHNPDSPPRSVMHGTSPDDDERDLRAQHSGAAPASPVAGGSHADGTVASPSSGGRRSPPGLRASPSGRHSGHEPYSGAAGAMTASTSFSFGEYMQVEASRIKPLPSLMEMVGSASDAAWAEATASQEPDLRNAPAQQSAPSSQPLFGMTLSLPPPSESGIDNFAPLSPASHRRGQTLESAGRMVAATPAILDQQPGHADPKTSNCGREERYQTSYGGEHSKGSGAIDEVHGAEKGFSGDGKGGAGGGLVDAEATGYAARRYKLRCLEISANGNVVERNLSRAEIMQAARDTLPKNAPSPKAIARWLGSPEEDSKELHDFKARYGTGKETSYKAMQKALRNYLRNSLQPRDIRQVDPAFSAKPALWVRHSALVVSLEGVRVIVLHDKVFLFDPDHSVAQAAVNVIQQSVMTSPEMLDDPDMPFEFRALEGVFIVGIMGLEKEFNCLNPEVERHLHELPTQLTSKMLEELRINKQRLNQFLSRAHSVREILEKLLDEDADMANMYLSEKHRSPHVSRDAGEHDQVEMLLEAYMQVIDELVNRADLLNDAIDDTEDLVMIHLDTLRNKLLSVELALSVFSMTFGFGGLISGVFGMNLAIPLFASSGSKFWFLGVVCFIIAFIIVVSWIILLQLRRRGLYTFRQAEPPLRYQERTSD